MRPIKETNPERPAGSKRFRPSFWSERLVPILLALLLLGLVTALVVVALSLLGVTPGV
jgi:hypothetical protein